jgi:hypothetical protein
MAASAASLPDRIFVSYRREDTAYPAGWLFEQLADHFGRDQVFKDIDSIELGQDFVEEITDAVGTCDVLLALIGDRWLTLTDASGRRRLDNPNDFVRIEIEAALARKVRVIPILVAGATMPDESELPPSLAKLVRRQALELSPARFAFDVGRLLKVLDKTLAEVRTTKDQAASMPAPAGTTPDTGTPAPPTAPDGRKQERTGTAAAEPSHPRPTRRQVWVALGSAVLIAALVAAVIYWPARDNGGGRANGGGTSPSPGPTQTSPSTGPTQLAWRSLTFPVKPALDAPGVAQHQGKLWVVGGGDSSEVYVYDPKTGQWGQGPRLPQAVNHAPLVSDGASLFLIGGLTGPSNRVLTTVYRLGSPDGTWMEDTPLPAPRFAGAAAWDGKRIVFAGGADTMRPRSAAADVWALEPGKWVALGRLHNAREHLAAATDGAGTVWFVGGVNVGVKGRPVYADVDAVGGATVTAADKLARPVQGLAALWTAESGFCVIGGSRTPPNVTAAPVGEVECAKDSATARAWPKLATTVYGAGAAVVDGTSYLVGGVTPSGSVALALGPG